MGEIADMMLEGDMCQWCGELLDGEGFPTICPGCQAREGVDQFGDPVQSKQHSRRGMGKSRKHKRDTACPHCGKLVAAPGLEQHVAAKHGGTSVARHTEGEKE